MTVGLTMHWLHVTELVVYIYLYRLKANERGMRMRPVLSQRSMYSFIR